MWIEKSEFCSRTNFNSSPSQSLKHQNKTFWSGCWRFQRNNCRKKVVHLKRTIMMIVVCLRCHLINSCIRDKAPPTQLLIEPQTSVTILLMYVPIKKNKSYVCSHKKKHLMYVPITKNKSYVCSHKKQTNFMYVPTKKNTS